MAWPAAVDQNSTPIPQRESDLNTPLHFDSPKPPQPPMASSSRLAGGGSQSLTVVYTVKGSDHYAVIPYPKTYEASQLLSHVERVSHNVSL